MSVTVGMTVGMAVGVTVGVTVVSAVDGHCGTSVRLRQEQDLRDI